MFEGVDLGNQLLRQRTRRGKEEERLLAEANRVLKEDLFAEDKILENLRQYNKAFEKLDEEDVDKEYIFSLSEIRQVAITYRLKFLDLSLFKPEVPPEAHFKIEELNREHYKELKFFKILAPAESFTETSQGVNAMLFIETNYDNYYLVHRWGNKLKWNRKFKAWPLRSFESLILTVAVITLLITLALPTHLITLDEKAEYWSGYRGAAFFHLLIFNMGVTVYFAFTFAKNFSNTIWNRYRDFD